MTPLKIYEMDHIVLNVGDIDRSLKFYTEVLGLAGERIEEFKAGKVGFPSVRINQDTIIDLSRKGKPGKRDEQDRIMDCAGVVAVPARLHCPDGGEYRDRAGTGR